MKTLLRKWRGLQVAAAMAAAILPLHGAQVKTLGGGPNNSGLSRYGSANGNTLLNAKFFNPYGVAQDDSGNLFIADRSNNKVRKITKPGQADSITSTFKSLLPSPVGVAVDGSNNVYVLTQGDGKLRKYSNTGRLLRTVSRLSSPTALAIHTNFNVYVVELGGSLKLIPPAGPTVLLGPGGFNQPRGIAILPDGRLAISASRNHAIYLVDPNTGVATLLAGGNGAGYNDGPGGLAQFDGPYGIATAPSGDLVVADRNNNRVRLVNTNSTVTTLFGVDKTQWAHSFPGWSDGDSTVAASRAPVGVTVGRDGTVYDTEVYWHLIRQVTGVALAPTGGSGVSTNVVGTNTFVGTNIISLGFESGEGSSDYVGAAGQHFYAPVTFAIAQGQPVYSFQMSLMSTNNGLTALNPANAVFVSMLRTQVAGSSPPIYDRIVPNYEFLNTPLNLKGIGWLERPGFKDLYDTTAQDLFTYSLAKDFLYGKDTGRIILGGYRVVIPSAAAPDETYTVALHNASGTSDGVSTLIPLRMPTDGSLGGGKMNSVKRITLGSRAYVLGDTVPFRWFNAGDFGDGALQNNDVMQIFNSAAGYNKPIDDSDLFDAMDVSNGSLGLDFGDDPSINSITNGDTLLQVDDIWVTFRRSLDPSLKWFARYWSNGVPQTVEVPNGLLSGFDAAPKAVLKSALAADVPPIRPSVGASVAEVPGVAGATFQLPVHVDLQGGYPLRVMLLSLEVEALDGSPSLTSPIQLQMTPAFGSPDLSRANGNNSYAGAWLDETIPGFSGAGNIALLNLTIPAIAGPGAAYRIHFNHFSGSPNGYALFKAHTSDALILLSDRSASTWNDGISDAWRLRYFGSIFSSDSAAAGDADGDGVINSIEYQNGTDPTDPLSN